MIPHLHFNTIHEAYLGVLRQVRDNPQHRCAPRGRPIREILEFKFTVAQPEAVPVITKDLERNVVIDRYSLQEFNLYDSRSNQAEDFAKASKFWNTIANPDGTINSAYGYLIWEKPSCGSQFEGVARTPWEWAKQSLTSDRDSRQAILRFNLPEHQWVGNKDFTCTMHGIFHIREDQLHLSVVMRSNDVVKGLAYDLPWFISLIGRMVDELKPTYPDLKSGTYTHEAHSMHMYESDLEVVNKMLGE